MAIYMKFEGVEGSATQADHQDWIEIDFFSWSVEHKVAASDARRPGGGGGDSGTGKRSKLGLPRIQPMVLAKPVDESSADLLDAAMYNTTGKTCWLEFTTTANQVYLKYQLDDTVITEIKHEVREGSDRPVETITLDFIKYKMTVYQLGIDNLAGLPFTHEHDRRNDTQLMSGGPTPGSTPTA